MDLWITGTPLWIRYGQLMDSRLPTTCPHLTHSSVSMPVTHKLHSFCYYCQSDFCNIQMCAVR